MSNATANPPFEPAPIGAASGPAWTKLFGPGEHIVWQADASPRLRRAEIARRRTMAGLLGFVCFVLACAFGWKLYETIVTPQPSPDLSAALGGPLYGALALTFAAVFIAQLGRLNPKLSAAVHYAATPTRIIAANAAGAIVDEVDVQDIAGLILGGRTRAPDLFVLRKHDDLNVRAFAIEHIDTPLDAKAIIEEKVLENESLEPTP